MQLPKIDVNIPVQDMTAEQVLKRSRLETDEPPMNMKDLHDLMIFLFTEHTPDMTEHHHLFIQFLNFITNTGLVMNPEFKTLMTDITYALLDAGVETGTLFFRSGCGCLYGFGVPFDVVKGLTFLRKAAEKFNNSYALFEIGKCFESGIGVELDLDIAIKYFRKSCKLLNPMGQYALGYCYLRGSGVESEPEKAFYWYSKAYEQNFFLGSAGLSYLYSEGIGCEKSAEKAQQYHSLSQSHDLPKTWQKSKELAHQRKKVRTLLLLARKEEASYFSTCFLPQAVFCAILRYSFLIK